MCPSERFYANEECLTFLGVTRLRFNHCAGSIAGFWIVDEMLTTHMFEC